MTYEVVRLSTGNLVGTYRTKQAAYDAVIAVDRRAGRDAAANLALGYENSEGEGYSIARGMELVDQSLASRTQKDPTPSQTTRQIVANLASSLAVLSPEPVPAYFTQSVPFPLGPSEHVSSMML